MNKAKGHLTFYGVRGSFPVARRSVMKYGGNTSCILFETEKSISIFDAGTGMINLGQYLIKECRNKQKIDIYLSHLHSDHIAGLPFFEPVFKQEYTINYAIPYKDVPLQDSVYTLFSSPFSPLNSDNIKAKINFIELDKIKPGKINMGDSVSVEYLQEPSHPACGTLLYRLNYFNKRVIYATDVESPHGFKSRTLDFILEADILIHDSQYLDRDYFSDSNPRENYGHSTVSMAVNNAINGRVKKLYLFHYDPSYTDDLLTIMLSNARKKFKNTFLAQESKKISLRR